MTMSKLAANKPGATPATPGLLSLNPDSFTSGGGLISDVDVVIKDAQFLMWDYNGSVATSSPALGITLRILGEEDDPDESKDHDQYYSCGKAEDWAPSSDGNGLVPVGTKTGLNNNTNAGLLIASLVNVGVPKTIFDSGNIKHIVGMKLHVERVPAPERSNATPRADGRKPEILIATKLIELPGAQAAAGKPKAGLSKVAPATRAAAPVSKVSAQPVADSSAGDVSSLNQEGDEELAGVVMTIVAEAGGSIAKKLIGPKVFAALKGTDGQKTGMMRATNDEFLMGLTEAGFTYDGATLSLG